MRAHMGLLALCACWAGAAHAQARESAHIDMQQCRLPNAAHRDSPAWQQPLVLALDVSAEGAITAARVQVSSGDAAYRARAGGRALDNAAAEALRHGSFRPALGSDGQPTISSINIEYVWKLQ